MINSIKFIIILSFCANYLYGVMRIGWLDDLSILILFFLSIGLVMSSTDKFLINKHSSIVYPLVLWLVLSVIFNYNSLLGYFYETYKIFLFIYFIPIIQVLTNEQRKKLYLWFERFCIIFFTINLGVISLQYTFGVEFLKLMGFSNEYINNPSVRGRYVGLFQGPNEFGDMLIVVFLFNEFWRGSYYKLLRNILFISILLSTSKHAMLSLLITGMLLVLGDREFSGRRKVLGLSALSIFFGLGLMLNVDAVVVKFNQYWRFLFLLGDVDDVSQFEYRALQIATGLKLLGQDIWGYGLGTWGDFSSTFRVGLSDVPVSKLSDSALIHLLVEQGVFILFYFITLLWIVIKADRDRTVICLSLICFWFIATTFTMGLSSGSWPVIFSFIYGVLYAGWRKV